MDSTPTNNLLDNAQSTRLIRGKTNECTALDRFYSMYEGSITYIYIYIYITCTEENRLPTNKNFIQTQRVSASAFYIIPSYIYDLCLLIYTTRLNLTGWALPVTDRTIYALQQEKPRLISAQEIAQLSTLCTVLPIYNFASRDYSYLVANRYQLTYALR